MNIYSKDPQGKAEACVIWMHGLGADAQDMVGLAEQLLTKAALRHVFIDAPVRAVTLNNGIPMRAWYDILGLKLTDREDREGILESQVLIEKVIDEQLKLGFQSEQIILAGFSQGGAMALYTALHYRQPLKAVVALSSYLPLASQSKAELAKTTPIFLAYGRFDPLVLPEWTQYTAQWLKEAGYQDLDLKEYPMEHSICFEEIKDLSHWFTQLSERS